MPYIFKLSIAVHTIQYQFYFSMDFFSEMYFHGHCISGYSAPVMCEITLTFTLIKSKPHVTTYCLEPVNQSKVSCSSDPSADTKHQVHLYITVWICCTVQEK